MNNKATIYSATIPSREQQAKFKQFLKQKYNKDFVLAWFESPELEGGFKLEVGSEVYDWTPNGRFRQLKEEIEKINTNDDIEIIPILKEVVTKFIPKVNSEEIGKVVSVVDSIVKIENFDAATYGEVVVFESGVKGMVQHIEESSVSCILFGDDSEVTEGSKAYHTHKTAGIPVGDEYLGRVIDALGNPIDGLGNITASDYRPLETPAPAIIDRDPVSRPLETGLLTIDSMFPIGRGQRELIIGDRQTGKTAIAIDTILNQKGKNVICIYVAIGQKASSVALLTENLRLRGALEYTIIVSAFASDSSSIQYIAPYAGCALGEYFMNQGKDVLIVYDDLSKHAIAYRTISLLLGRAPGREAYPGDVFYLHSRLLERAAQLSKAHGGGSMTALPIVETQASDVSAYIPTNIISITDGQIFLESDLFFAGQRPAINIGLSVSRVGGAAQTKAMKKAAGTLRLDLSQYREMEVFTQFASDLDDTTKQLLTYGKGLMQVLRQLQYQPLKQYEQVITLVCGLDHVFVPVEIKNIKECQMKLLNYIEKNDPTLCKELETKRELTAEIRKAILDHAHEFVDNYLSNRSVE